MNLRLQAEADLSFTLEDTENGFGWDISITPPVGDTVPMSGQSDDIAQIIDPDTGQAVSGRLASVTLRLSSLYAANLQIPKAIPDEVGKPWVVEFADINGLPYKFKVSESNPDRALGVVVLILEVYQ